VSDTYMEKLEWKTWKDWNGGQTAALTGDAPSDGRRTRRPEGRLRRRWFGRLILAK